MSLSLSLSPLCLPSELLRHFESDLSESGRLLFAFPDLPIRPVALLKSASASPETDGTSLEASTSLRQKLSVCPPRCDTFTPSPVIEGLSLENLPASKLVMGSRGNCGRQAAASLAEAKLDVIYTRLTSGSGGGGRGNITSLQKASLPAWRKVSAFI